ncbi:hypothetical protein BDP27DRAFT_859785 [Rhodocollybia butyracea]|uniref:Uncharacterized protein n=1 Tax=Rhodocollybia butyracea TaxID=206335 RepID=A0A9P5TX29_9AGAR|nr:hypothetical protein BDP27DRAFT_859785 [Rhodocollybia butyracea]
MSHPLGAYWELFMMSHPSPCYMQCYKLNTCCRSLTINRVFHRLCTVPQFGDASAPSSALLLKH